MDDFEKLSNEYMEMVLKLSPAQRAVLDEIDTDELETDYFEKNDLKAFVKQFPGADEAIYDCVKTEKEYLNILDDLIEEIE